MKIKKIISGGQTGADRAALDFAIDNGISHGGWVPKGRLAEDGIIPEKYHMDETESCDYNIRTEKNIMDSDGTLILSHGRLTGGSALTKALARKHQRPCLHIDIKVVPEFEAAIEIICWIRENSIETLNVAGARSSRDAAIYAATTNLLETVVYIGMIEENMPDSVNKPFSAGDCETALVIPESVDAAVDRLMEDLPLKDKVGISALKEQELFQQLGSLELYIRNYYGLSGRNMRLLESCRQISGVKNLDAASAALFIIRKLWDNLRETHAIRRVK